LFASNKNYEELPLSIFNNNLEKKTTHGGEMTDSENSNYRTYTIDYVIKKLNEFGEENAKELIRAVANWKIRTTEKVLKSLLKNS
jgi:hypothetical protein